MNVKTMFSMRKPFYYSRNAARHIVTALVKIYCPAYTVVTVKYANSIDSHSVYLNAVQRTAAQIMQELSYNTQLFCRNGQTLAAINRVSAIQFQIINWTNYKYRSLLKLEGQISRFS